MKITKKELQLIIQKQAKLILLTYDDRSETFEKLLLISKKFTGSIGLLKLYLQNHSILSMKVNALIKSRKALYVTNLIRNLIKLLDYINS